MTDDVFGIIGTIQGGAFRVDAVVAEGGFAVVYRAHHAAFRADVALKCLKIPHAMTEEVKRSFLEKFREEAELLFRLSSAIPSVVRPLHVGTLEQRGDRFVPFIALEWLDGYTLDKLISTRALERAPPLDLRAAVKLLTPVADALCRAHRFPTADGVVSVIHRDLKPENIFIAKGTGRDVTKILDFGIAKAKSTTTQLVGQQSANESPLSAFTPAYGAPEQWLPKRYGQTGPWTDVWGLALTVVEAVCGHAPIDGDHAAMMGAAIDPVRRPTPRSEGVRVTDEVEALFTQALAVDPRDRFHDVGAFWNALCRTLGLPEVVGDASRSAPPPPLSPDGNATLSAPNDGVCTEVARLAAPPAPAVPDLIIGPESGRHPLRQQNPPDSTRAPPSGSTKAPKPAGTSRDPNALFGNAFEPLDDGVAARSIPLDDDKGFGLSPASSSSPRPRIVSAGGYASRIRNEPKLDLRSPLKLLVVAVFLMAFDWGYSVFMGEALRFGPARMLWLAGPVAALGAVQLLVRLLAHGE